MIGALIGALIGAAMQRALARRMDSEEPFFAPRDLHVFKCETCTKRVVGDAHALPRGWATTGVALHDQGALCPDCTSLVGVE